MCVVDARRCLRTGRSPFLRWSSGLRYRSRSTAFRTTTQSVPQTQHASLLEERGTMDAPTTPPPPLLPTWLSTNIFHPEAACRRHHHHRRHPGWMRSGCWGWKKLKHKWNGQSDGNPLCNVSYKLLDIDEGLIVRRAAPQLDRAGAADRRTRQHYAAIPSKSARDLLSFFFFKSLGIRFFNGRSKCFSVSDAVIIFLIFRGIDVVVWPHWLKHCIL